MENGKWKMLCYRVRYELYICMRVCLYVTHAQVPFTYANREELSLLTEQSAYRMHRECVSIMCANYLPIGKYIFANYTINCSSKRRRLTNVFQFSNIYHHERSQTSFWEKELGKRV